MRGKDRRCENQGSQQKWSTLAQLGQEQDFKFEIPIVWWLNKKAVFIVIRT